MADPVVGPQRRRHCLGGNLPFLGAGLDIGEKKTHRAGGQWLVQVGIAWLNSGIGRDQMSPIDALVQSQVDRSLRLADEINAVADSVFSGLGS